MTPDEKQQLRQSAEHTIEREVEGLRESNAEQIRLNRGMQILIQEYTNKLIEQGQLISSLQSQVEVAREFLDEELITKEWLVSVGFKAVPSDMGPNYFDHYEIEGERLNIWEYNQSGKWVLNLADHIGMRTRGKLRMMAKLHDISLSHISGGEGK